MRNSATQNELASSGQQTLKLKKKDKPQKVVALKRGTQN